MPVEGFFGFQLLGADATLVDEEVGEVDALHVVAHVAPRGLHALADGAHVAPAPALPVGYSTCVNIVRMSMYRDPDPVIFLYI